MTVCSVTGTSDKNAGALRCASNALFIWRVEQQGKRGTGMNLKGHYYYYKGQFTDFSNELLSISAQCAQFLGC